MSFRDNDVGNWFLRIPGQARHDEELFTVKQIGYNGFSFNC